MRSQQVLRNGALMGPKLNSATMDEHLFLFGQRVLTPSGEGEVVDTIGDKSSLSWIWDQLKPFPLTTYRTITAQAEL